ncbi:HLA class II histocompatibility antigen gamma chain isoform X1 [Coturnix japonica]|uniref:HLA class II histocompatibility antigen gamma chain isoform X1 n=1 Tax=Coturnix japonica TaxID=93934 RepID=UPI000777A2AB|nr:HLA class II histocompatibility antigen gamma chain isoform X1 [Coturnix japonica]
MAEEQRDLISSDGSSGVLPIGNNERSAVGRRTVLSAMSILVALLIAGQAVTIYYVYQQSGQISKLTKTSQTLKLEALQKKLPMSAQPANKMSMSMMNMPMAMKVLPLAPSVGDMPMEAVRPRSNKTEDQVRHLLLKADPRKTFPELKEDLLGNLKRLKKAMNAMDWQDFEAWMHKWLLFEMAKGPKGEEQNAIPAEKVQTKCQAEASFRGVHPGRFRPECDENGDYLPKQCLASTGYCWCCYKNGTRIEGTATRGELDCSVAAPAPTPTEPEEMIFSGVDMLKAAK